MILGMTERSIEQQVQLVQQALHADSTDMIRFALSQLRFAYI